MIGNLESKNLVILSKLKLKGTPQAPGQLQAHWMCIEPCDTIVVGPRIWSTGTPGAWGPQ